MPSKAGRETQKYWMEEITRAKKPRDKWKKNFKVDLALQYFEGNQKPPGVPDAEWITINMVYASVKATLPSLYSVDPYFYIKLRRTFNPDADTIVAWERKGENRQNMLNYQKDELDLKSKARLAIQDALFSFGVLKTRVTTEDKENPDAGQPVFGEDGEPLINSKTNEPVLEPDIIPTNEQYDILRKHPDDFLWSADARTLEDEWCWVADAVTTTVEDALNNPNYNKTVLNNLGSPGLDKEEIEREKRKQGGDIPTKSERKKTKKKKKGESTALIRIWEIYDLKKEKWITIVEGGEAPLIPEAELPPGVDKHPYSVLRFTLRGESPLPIPPMSQALKPQDEYNQARSDIQTHRKRFNRIYHAAGQWDEGEIEKFITGEDGTVVMSSDPNASLQNIQMGQMDQNRYTETAMLRNEFNEVGLGATDAARGVSTADSATEAGILNQRQNIREGDALSQVSDFVVGAARRLDLLIATHMTRDEAVQISGPEGEKWVNVGPEDYEEIEGKYHYTVNIGSTLPRLPQMERSSLIAFLTLIANNPHLMQSPALLKEMAEMHHIENETMLKELLGIAEKMVQAGLGGQQQGSQAGITENRPQSAIGGQAGAPVG